MADDVTTFNLEYENARRAVQAQVDYWTARAGNLALSDVDRSTSDSARLPALAVQ